MLTTGFLRELRRLQPRAFITLIVKPAVYNLAELCPYVNEVLIFSGEKQSGFIEQYRAAAAFCKDHLWHRRYDLCFCPQWDFDRYFALFLGYMSGARQRIGYTENLYEGKARNNRGHDHLLTLAVKNPKALIHEVERNFYLLEAFGGVAGAK